MRGVAIVCPKLSFSPELVNPVAEWRELGVSPVGEKGYRLGPKIGLAVSWVAYPAVA
jgi:hypothetical protein